MAPPGPLRRGRGRAARNHWHPPGPGPPGAALRFIPTLHPEPSQLNLTPAVPLAAGGPCQGPYRPPALSGKARAESVGQAATGPVRLGVGRAGPGAHRRNPEV